jgi:hypothetical protein
VTGQAPLVDFCNQHSPRARPIESSEPRLAIPRPVPRISVKTHAFGGGRWKTTPSRHDRDPAETGPQPQRPAFVWMPCRVARPRCLGCSRLRALTRCSGAIQPRFHGSGARRAFALPGAFRRDCSPRKLRPDPIGSDTCRREARRDAGWRGRPRRAHTCLRVPMTSPPGGPACAQARKRGPPDARC